MSKVQFWRHVIQSLFKYSRGWGGKGVPISSHLGGLRVVSSASKVMGSAPAENKFGLKLSSKNASDAKDLGNLYRHKILATCPLTAPFKLGALCTSVPCLLVNPALAVVCPGFRKCRQQTMTVTATNNDHDGHNHVSHKQRP